MFSPNAIVTDNINIIPYSLFTYDSLATLEAAKNQIELWKKDKYIKVLCAYIQDDNKNIVYLENNVDAFGYVNYKNEEQKEKNR